MFVSGIQLLLDKFIQNQCGPEEASQVLAWLEATEYNAKHKLLLCQLLTQPVDTELMLTNEFKADFRQNFQKTLKKIHEKATYTKPFVNLTWMNYTPDKFSGNCLNPALLPKDVAESLHYNPGAYILGVEAKVVDWRYPV